MGEQRWDEKEIKYYVLHFFSKLEDRAKGQDQLVVKVLQ